MKGRACMKFNEKECAKKILGLVGGTENVQSVTHCMTRLRIETAYAQWVFEYGICV